MKSIVLSYSLTGNNQKLAANIAAELGVPHIKIFDTKPRTTVTIVFDILFNRIPQVQPAVEVMEGHDLVIFVGPVWMGQAASPLRAYLRQLKTKPSQYAFVSISGGADGPNPKLEAELQKRTGKKPAAVIDLHIADLLPADPKPTRDATSAYRINDKDLKSLTTTVLKSLNETVAAQAL